MLLGFLVNARLVLGTLVLRAKSNISRCPKLRSNMESGLCLTLTENNPGRSGHLFFGQKWKVNVKSGFVIQSPKIIVSQAAGNHGKSGNVWQRPTFHFCPSCGQTWKVGKGLTFPGQTWTAFKSHIEKSLHRHIKCCILYILSAFQR